MLLKMALFHSFESATPHCICTPHLYPFICWWRLRMLPRLGYYKYCQSELHVSFWIWVFISSEYTPRGGIAGSYSNSVFKGTSTLFSTVAASIYFPTNSVGRFSTPSLEAPLLFFRSLTPHTQCGHDISLTPPFHYGPNPSTSTAISLAQATIISHLHYCKSLYTLVSLPPLTLL